MKPFSPHPPKEWGEALESLTRGWPEPLNNLRLDESSAAVWRGWAQRQPLFAFEKRNRHEWDARDRGWLLPLLWCCVDQACWQHRYPVAERLAKRAVGRTLEVALDPVWAVLSYLALVRAYLAQGRLDQALSVLDNLPACALSEVRALAHLHRGEALRRQSRNPEPEFSQGRALLAHPSPALELLCSWLTGRPAVDEPSWAPSLRQVAKHLQSRQALQQGRPEEARALAEKAGQASAIGLGLAAASRAESAFARQDWGVALTDYRLAASQLAALRPGAIDLGPLAPLPLAWPVLPDLAWPWPLAFLPYTPAEAVQQYLFCQGQTARCLRSLGRDEDARREAGEGKAVRQTSGAAQLISLSDLTFPNTISLKFTLKASGRHPTWLAWDSAGGELEMISSENLSSKLVLVDGQGRVGEDFARSFLAAPLPDEPLQFRIYSPKSRAGVIEAITYALWVGFASGPPLYLPVVIG